jgi:hypothetical protein
MKVYVVTIISGYACDDVEVVGVFPTQEEADTFGKRAVEEKKYLEYEVHESEYHESEEG